MSANIEIRELSTAIGVEVRYDLRRPADATLREYLRTLFLKHHLLLFRNQCLEPEEHVHIGYYFGHVLLSAHDGVSYVSNDPAKGGVGSSELAFHSDLAFSPAPYLGLSLYALDVINGASCTRFANGVRAMSRLSTRVLNEIEGRQALHCIGLHPAKRNRVADLPPGAPCTAHPVILKHPLTGIEILYVSLNQTDSIVDLDPGQSEAIMAELFRVLYARDNVYEHWWHQGDLIIWDNLALQHGRPDISCAGPRTLHRVTLGEKSFFDLYPSFQYAQETGYITFAP
jgi:taurine dioxygenase